MAYRKWTDNQLIEAVKSSVSISQVIRKIGLKSTSSGNHQTVRKRIDELKLSISHFSENVIGPCNRLKKSTNDILVENSTYIGTSNLKKRLINEGLLKEECYECGITEWRDKKLSLQLDHKNGNNRDNRIENLRILCPNCHSQTTTYCRGTRTKKIYICSDCGNEVTTKSNLCRSCNGKRKSKTNSLCKITWIETSELIKMVNKYGYTEVGKLLGVSDNAVRKRIKSR